ncbi:hypothetical protein [Methanolobus sp. ZRKC5]|uniref:hypothetical protein n=1 Tax=unclassified Methanolobus TaxID=2629569 RepID=UPI00313EC053
MKQILLVLLAIALLLLPASAETLTFEDTAGHDYYGICADVTDYKPTGLVYGFSPLDSDENYIPNSNYDTFLTSSDDVYEYLDFHFKSNSSFELPVTFWYTEGQRDLIFSVDFEENPSWLFFFTDSMTYEIKDNNSNVLVSKTYSSLHTNYARFTVTPNELQVSRIDRSFLNQYTTGASVNLTMSPLTAVTFDLTEINNNASSYCVVKVVDDELTQEGEELPGWIQWLYNRISFMDPDMVLYNALTYVVFMWDILSFLLTFMLFSTWSYFILANVVGLFYGILQSNRGTFGMIEGYFKGMYYSFLLPIQIFKFLINLIISLANAILPL